MYSTKYRDLLALLISLDEVESRAKALAEHFPELRTVAEATSDAADLCDLAVTVEDIVDDRLFGPWYRSPRASMCKRCVGYGGLQRLRRRVLSSSLVVFSNRAEMALLLRKLILSALIIRRMR